MSCYSKPKKHAELSQPFITFYYLVVMMRPLNGLMTVLAVYLGWRVTHLSSPFLPTAIVSAMCAAFLVVGFGNVANDINDRGIDVTGHPNRVLPQQRVSVTTALVFTFVLGLLGLLLSFCANGATTLSVCVINCGLIFLYEHTLKKQPFVGNITVAYLIASSFLFGAVSDPSYSMSYEVLYPLLAVAFCTNIAREVLKDLEDKEADQTVRHTVAICFSKTSLLIGTSILTLGTVLYSLASPLVTLYSPSHVLLFYLADAVFVIAIFLSCQSPRYGQKALKVGMLIFLLSLVLIK